MLAVVKDVSIGWYTIPAPFCNPLGVTETLWDNALEMSNNILEQTFHSEGGEWLCILLLLEPVLIAINQRLPSFCSFFE